MRLIWLRCMILALVLAGAGALYVAVPPAPPAPASPRSVAAPAPTPAPSSPGLAVAAAAPRWSGTGEGETEAAWLEPGLVRFTIEHPAGTPFAVFLLGAEGEHLALLANDLRPVRGEQVFGVRRAGSYHLHVIAQDAWSVDLAPWTAQEAQLPAVLRGSGLAVLGPFALPAGARPFAWSHSGAIGWTAVLWSSDGQERLELAQSQMGQSGAGSLTIPRAGSYVLMVQADGDWELDLTRK
jgi:hypothetical protein